MNSLFDLLEPPEDGDVKKLRAELAQAEAELAALKSGEWHEAPEALFKAWPLRKQLAYCAARDDDAALRAATDEERTFYSERAAAYRTLWTT